MLTVRYALEEGAAAGIRVTYPFETSTLPLSTWRGVALGAAVYLSQLCLTPELRLGFPVSDRMVEDVRPLLQMLYDVRRWKDGLPPVDVPEVRHPGAEETPPVDVALEKRRALLMFSGGKDSTLSALLLADNGYDIDALHVPVNAGAEGPEDAAVAHLSGALGLGAQRLGYEHPDFLAFSRAHATPGAWDDFPLANRVPFGRDLLLALLAVPVAAARRAGCLSLGHDNECRNACFEHGGRSVPRNDVESTRGALALEAYVRRHLLADLRLLPPLAALPELRILHAMLVGHPEHMGRTSFCFWGRSCGRCAKCLRYYLAQRLFGVDVLEFDVNPLGRGAAPELDDLLQQDGVGLLFQRQVLLCLVRLVQRGDVRPGEDRLADLSPTLIAAVAPHLDQWERELLAVHADPQLPPGFTYRSLSPVA